MITRARGIEGRLAVCAAAGLAALALCCAAAWGPALAFAEGSDGGNAYESEAAFEEDVASGGQADEFAGRTAEAISGGLGSVESVPVETSDSATDGSGEGEDLGKNLVDPTQRADNSFIYDTSIGAIAGQSSLYDKRTVQVEGEVIGDRIAAHAGYYWIELSSSDEGDAATISVLISEDQTAQIDRYGRYGVTGTTLQVRGTYHQACDEHEGLSDIHATNSAVVAHGVDHKDAFELNAFLPGIATVVVGIVLLLVFRFARERMR